MSLKGRTVAAEDCRALFPNLKNSFCVYLWGPPKAPNSTPFASSAVRSAESYGPGDKDHIKQSAQQPGPVENHPPVPGPSQSLQLLESLDAWVRVTHPSEEYAVSKIQMDPLSVVILSL